MSNDKLDKHPINKVLWVDKNKVQANDYNPNSVAKIELKLLQKLALIIMEVSI